MQSISLTRTCFMISLMKVAQSRQQAEAAQDFFPRNIESATQKLIFQVAGLYYPLSQPLAQLARHTIIQADGRQFGVDIHEVFMLVDDLDAKTFQRGQGSTHLAVVLILMQKLKTRLAVSPGGQKHSLINIALKRNRRPFRRLHVPTLCNNVRRVVQGPPCPPGTALCFRLINHMQWQARATRDCSLVRCCRN